MTIKQKRKNSIHFLLVLLLLVFAVGGWGNSTAFADTKQYTSALTDLKTDPGFSTLFYPDDPKDYSVQVIQIAESEENELFVYTYQPCQKTTYLVATDINMSLSKSPNGTKLYTLTLLNCEGVFCKYKVNALSVGTAATRYYNISSIYREWINGIDDEADNDNEIGAVAYPVGQLWTAKTDNTGNVSYGMTAEEVVIVTDKHVGFLRYPNGFYLYGNESCDSHYVAFSCNWDIDILFEVNVSYVKRERRSKPMGTGTAWSDPETVDITLHYDDTASNPGDGAFGHKYTWKRIESVDEFVKKENLTDDAKKAVESKQWVLRFAETGYNDGMNFPELVAGVHLETEISEVTILRLMFDCDGKIYNLGVVDNKQSGDDDPDNKDHKWNFFKWFAGLLGVPVWAAKAIFFGILAVLVLAIALPILSLVFPVVGTVLKAIVGGVITGVKYLFVGLWWIVCLPFRGIAALIGKIKGGKDGDA